MIRANIYKRSIGVNFDDDGGSEVLVWAPLARSVELSVKNGKVLPLKKEKHGYWSLFTDELQPGNSYGFSLDGKNALPDPASVFQQEGVHGLSVATDVKKFDWTDGNWQNPNLSDYIIYELHTGTFTTDGTFAAIESKLDYLVELGISAIELMPVAQFPGERNWGYDGVFPFAVHNSYGGPAALKKLVDVCHQKGLAVILDVVYNHMGPEGNYLGQYGPYFTEKYKTPWGGAINFDDAWCDGVRAYFIENVLMWFRDFHIDALRMDAVHAIKDFSPKHILQEIKEYVDQLMQATGRSHYLIIECDLNDNRFIKPIAGGGFGIDAQWSDEFHHALRVTAGQKQDGYYADFKGIGHLTKAYSDAYVYDGRYSEERHRFFGSKTTGLAGQQFVVFSQNHDQVGNRMLGERTSALVSFEMQKLMASAVMLSPYLPLLFMGEEYSERNPFLYFVSHTDPELVEAVRKGRREEFKGFMTDAEAPDPQAIETFEHSKLQWGLINQPFHRAMLSYYKALIKLRKTHPVLKSCNRENVEVTVNEPQKVLILRRWDTDQQLLCLLNFSDQKEIITVNQLSGRWQKIFDSAARQWDGPGELSDINSDSTITLQPESVTIYNSNNV
ncbi:malto-oligosyltrehalose trehalohydrolase [Mucilaginibacter panaciglaebae]|uniref:Malto-oligosyltrehalose trehalohydrolase n=1 Tax=Mucilaginibacter panaciglaebae TaxID=502331 RepID=A0ABP7WEW2_9SPHI